MLGSKISKEGTMNENGINENELGSDVLNASNASNSSNSSNASSASSAKQSLLYKPPVLSGSDAREPSLVQRIKSSYLEGNKTLCRKTVELSSNLIKRSSDRMCLIFQSVIFMLFTAGTAYALYLLYLASDWFFAVGDNVSRTVSAVLLSILMFAVVVVGVMLWFGMLETARRMKNGQSAHIYDIFFALGDARRGKYFKAAVLLSLLLTAVGTCFVILLYGTGMLSVLLSGYYGEFGRISVIVSSLPLILTLIVFSIYLLIKVFCVFELICRCPDDRISDIFIASALISRGREKELGGLLLRWFACAMISVLSVGVLIPIFFMPGVCAAYTVSTDILITDRGDPEKQG